MRVKNIKLVKARKDKGLTQENLADKLNVKKSTISNWENGYSSPQVAQAIKVAMLLNTEVSFLFSSEVQDFHTDE
ncbi:helix-turn-helix transcriptional regulator [Listeria welshimeri]|uniref:helix-turn-helix transcriptional regulator n=1 Tax=Listeria welshimeri TaxID=1643 RepID=UPI0018887C47|nr:helix-turn-helix transcriptional regulator [Listeria welshimeri]MBF2601378.1 helix-turn-helix transcriptional regulator [Listeria welshimeri]